jgi:hypothetical protein
MPLKEGMIVRSSTTIADKKSTVRQSFDLQLSTMSQHVMHHFDLIHVLVFCQPVSETAFKILNSQLIIIASPIRRGIIDFSRRDQNMVDDMYSAVLGQRICKSHPLEAIDLQRRIRSKPGDIDRQLPPVQEGRQIKMREALYTKRLDLPFGRVEDVRI